MIRTAARLKLKEQLYKVTSTFKPMKLSASPAKLSLISFLKPLAPQVVLGGLKGRSKV